MAGYWGTQGAPLSPNVRPRSSREARAAGKSCRSPPPPLPGRPLWGHKTAGQPLGEQGQASALSGIGTRVAKGPETLPGPIRGVGPAPSCESATGLLCERDTSSNYTPNLPTPRPPAFLLQRPLIPRQGGKVSGGPGASPPPGGRGAAQGPLVGGPHPSFGGHDPGPGSLATGFCWQAQPSPQGPVQAPLPSSPGPS